MLRDHDWRQEYNTEDGNLAQLVFVPALKEAKSYDRLTGYFNAAALKLAASGVEGLLRNDGRMRLVVGCTLEQAEVEAIKRGEDRRAAFGRILTKSSLEARDIESYEALELLAWMVKHGRLEIKVAVRCDAKGEPVAENAGQGIFHSKIGVFADPSGDKIAWNGSVNETAAGWLGNWESIDVYTSWEEKKRVDGHASNFESIWAGNHKSLIVFDVPEAVRRDLLRYSPLKGKRPARVDRDKKRRDVWALIRQAPSREDGEDVGEATAPISAWPHQARAFDRLYGSWPPRLLIADEVGLGKTIQAGLLLRQALLAGRAKRILILAPKAVLEQWQIELREKFNLNWPIYAGGKLTWSASPAFRNRREHAVGRGEWHREPAVIASSHLMRRSDRAEGLLDAEPWDLVVLDEAHHARRKSPGSKKQGGPNMLLKLMKGLKDRTQGLILMTATPMQVHPVEVWDLLELLGLPPEWSERAFLDFFKGLEESGLSGETMEWMASQFQSAERAYGETDAAIARRASGLSQLKTNKVLRALRDEAKTPRRQLDDKERRGAAQIMRIRTPVQGLISRHTRELLRRYAGQGRIKRSIADRQVEDRFLEMTARERAMYLAVEDYIAEAYDKASASERNAVGFVMTIYRRRLASSFTALRKTLGKRRDAISGSETAGIFGSEEDLPDDEAVDEIADEERAARLEREALKAEEGARIDDLLEDARRLPPDSKLAALKVELRRLREMGYDQAMVFTQYVDTMDFLREALLEGGEWTLLCFSGRGGEAPGADGAWEEIDRDEAKRRFRKKRAEILLCTDAAAEGLNFQFCGAVINYDMPWNPMRVEQRIGRIDRLGQKHKNIQVVNLHYEGTVETDIYRALRGRIQLFEIFVGRLQPILARMPGTISQSVLAGAGRDDAERKDLVREIEREVEEAKKAGFDIDAVTEGDLAMPLRKPATVTMDDLDRVISSRRLMPSGYKAARIGKREYKLRTPGMDEPVRVTTDPDHFEAHAGSLELWSPGNPLFPKPCFAKGAKAPEGTLKELLAKVLSNEES